MRLRRRWLWVGIPAALLLAPAVGWAAYAAVTWHRFGRDQRSASTDPLMQRFMPRYHIAEVHRTDVAAPAALTFAAALRMDLHHSAIIHAIFRSRELLLGAEGSERPATLAMLDELRSLGWGVLEEVPDRQIVLGAVTRPWESEVVFRALPAREFAAFDSAGYVKIVVTFAADSLGPDASTFRTETRAVATDAVSRWRFRRYWSIFSPGILLIRSQALNLVRRGAEEQPQSDEPRA